MEKLIILASAVTIAELQYSFFTTVVNLLPPQRLPLREYWRFADALGGQNLRAVGPFLCHSLSTTVAVCIFRKLMYEI